MAMSPAMNTAITGARFRRVGCSGISIHTTATAHRARLTGTEPHCGLAAEMAKTPSMT